MASENLSWNADRARCNISVASRLPIRVELVYDLADHVGGGGATNSGGGARQPMLSESTDRGTIIDIPLDAEVNPEDADYQRTKNRVIGAGQPGIRVSAFNSSI
jgi:hypothetical protein